MSFIGRPRGPRWRVAGASLLACALVVAAAGTAEAARRWDRRHADTLLSGLVVGGVPVGGMSVKEAEARVGRLWEQPLDEAVTLRVGDRTVTRTWRELGAATDAEAALRHVQRAQSEMSLAARLWYRLSGRSLERSYPVHRTLDDTTARAALEAVAVETEQPAINSAVDASAGIVRLTPERDGMRLDVEAALGELRAAMSGAEALAQLPVRTVAPAVRRSDHGTILLVRVGENTLSHYVGEQLVKTYRVATGQPGHSTPTGAYQVTAKRYRPTWVNPAKRPGAWGWSLPARIGPGPSNPLGTRAMNINAPGIRIHGTSNASSIGRNASHGCIRMLMPEVEELYEHVSVGTPVFIIRSGELKPHGDDGPRAEGA